ncbi:MAG: hypothetical protein ACJ71F_00075 [Nitrososphaeraceae archaeon]
MDGSTNTVIDTIPVGE